MLKLVDLLTEKKLRVFDFDDTLVKSNSKVFLVRNGKPVRQFLKDVGFTDVYVVALGDANPQKKANWIQSQIQKGYDDILFLDDSPKNVKAVKKLKQKYPNIKMDARVVSYD